MIDKRESEGAKILVLTATTGDFTAEDSCNMAFVKHDMIQDEDMATIELAINKLLKRLDDKAKEKAL